MGARIIVIDNSEVIRKLLTYNLQRRGFQVFSYPYTGINQADLEPLHPDLILLDFNIRDDGQGWDFLQILKMDDATAKIPILIFTTSPHFSPELEGFLSARYIHVVYKPFDLATFLPLVQKTLSLASQAQSLFFSERSLPVLVVDDSDDFRDAIATVLRLEGYQVVTAANGRMALDAVYKAEYCLILLDIAMPIMNGLEFLKAYDGQPRPHAPVAIISGETDILTKALPSFVIDRLPKPFEISQLLVIVKKYAQPFSTAHTS
jgi:DNA-binding response OmpR family regulator